MFCSARKREEQRRKDWEKFKEEQFQRTAPMAADIAYVAVTLAKVVQMVLDHSEKSKMQEKPLRMDNALCKWPVPHKLQPFSAICSTGQA